MDKEILLFFKERGLSPSSYFEAIELLRKEWMINYKIDAASTNVKIEVPYFRYVYYAASTIDAIKNAVNFIVIQIR